MVRIRFAISFTFFVGAVFVRCFAGSQDISPAVIGDEPALKQHITQDDINADQFSLEELIDHGRATLISEAILAHGGEAELEHLAFEKLSDYERSAIVEFLQTLRIEEGNS